MLRPPQHLVWMQVAIAIMIVVHPVRDAAHPSFPQKSIIQSVAQETVHFISPGDAKTSSDISLISNLISKSIFVTALASFSLATLRLYFWNLSPYLICDLKKDLSKSQRDKAARVAALLDKSSKIGD